MSFVLLFVGLKPGVWSHLNFCGSGSGQNVVAPFGSASLVFSIRLEEVFSVLHILAVWNVLRSIGTFFAVLHR